MSVAAIRKRNFGMTRFLGARAISAWTVAFSALIAERTAKSQFDLASRMAASRLGCADQPSDQAVGIGWRRVAAPRDILVGPNERKVAAVEIARVALRQVDHLERHAALVRRGLDRACVRRPAAEPQQREASAELVEQRVAIVASLTRPVVRGAAARHAGRRVVEEVVGGR